MAAGFLVARFGKEPKIVPSTDSLQCPVGQLMGTEGGGGKNVERGIVGQEF